MSFTFTVLDRILPPNSHFTSVHLCRVCRHLLFKQNDDAIQQIKNEINSSELYKKTRYKPDSRS